MNYNRHEIVDLWSRECREGKLVFAARYLRGKPAGFNLEFRYHDSGKGSCVAFPIEDLSPLLTAMLDYESAVYPTAKPAA